MPEPIPDRRRTLRFGLTAATAATLLAAISLAAALPAAADRATPADTDWPAYNGGPEGQHYSPLAQIDRSNVAALQQAWRFDTGPGGLQTNPLVVGRTLFAFTPSLNVVALDAASGRELWRFDPGIPAPQPSRGFAWWRGTGASPRLFAGVMNRLYALDPATGHPVEGFGEGGYVDLRKGLGRDYANQAVYLTTPGVVFEDLIIVGFRTGESLPAAPGAIRAYDVRTGALRWSFATIPAAGQPGAETWPAGAADASGAANVWAGLALDRARGIIYAPTGSAATDFYGADRVGDDLYANTLLALDARTGARIWHFQAVHHDIWDRDFPSPPLLARLQRGGRTVDAVAQPTKHGVLFVFDRVTGKPLFPIVERSVPGGAAPGETASPTQPFPQLPAPFARQRLTEDLLTRRTPEAHAWALEQFRSFRSEGPFTPLAVGRQTVVFPGFDGGAEWGGSALDPKSGVLYVNANDLPWTGSLAESGAEGPAAVAYQAQCAGCHGADRSGFPPAFPSLIERAKGLSDAEIAAAIRNGKGRMPAFPIVANSPQLLSAVIAYVRTGQENVSDKREVGSAGSGPSPPARYRFTGFRKFLDPEGYPAVVPPWGTLTAIDLNSGRQLWRRPLGEYPELAAKGLADTGSENYGGPLVTAGGVVVIGATNFDSAIRAFDSRTGKLLWRGRLPYAGNATPATYSVDGRQYVVIATSNARNPAGPQGSAYVAFALPRRTPAREGLR